MTEQINWDEIEAAFGFKPVENGEYITKLLKAEVADTPTQSGSYAITFELDKKDGKTFPYSTTHWISFKNDNWRIHHMKSLLVDMGVDEAKAKSKVQECEFTGTKDQIVDAYRKAFNAWASKHPTVKVVVETQAYKHKDKNSGAEELRPDGHRTEFAGESYMPPQTMEDLQNRYPNVPVAGEAKVEGVDDLRSEEINLDDIPF